MLSYCGNWAGHPQGWMTIRLDILHLYYNLSPCTPQFLQEGLDLVELTSDRVATKTP